jgi:hypothetical protein
MAKRYGIAGRSAHEMAEQRYKKAAIYGGTVILVAIILFITTNWVSFHFKASLLGFICIVALSGVFVYCSDPFIKKGEYIKKRAKDADRGAYAEEVVAERLKGLPDSYCYFNDLAFEGFNIDHIVVGPGGIFLIETKSHSGEVDVKGEVLLLNGAKPEKDFFGQTWSQTFQLREYLKKQTSREWKVKPVLCFTRAFVKVRQPLKGITMVNKKYLAEYLLKQSHCLNAMDIEVVVGLLRARTTRNDKVKSKAI